MGKIIQFPNNKFDKKSKVSVDPVKNKNKLTLIASMLSLVVALSVFNNREDSKSPLAAKGMRGIASVDSSQSEVNNKAVIKQIKSENSRKVANLGRKPNAKDLFIFKELGSGNFSIAYDSNNNIVKVERQTGVSVTEKQFNVSMIEGHLAVFGASAMDTQSSNVEKFEKADGPKLVKSYDLMSAKGVVISKAVVTTTDQNELVSIEVQ